MAYEWEHMSATYSRFLVARDIWRDLQSLSLVATPEELVAHIKSQAVASEEHLQSWSNFEDKYPPQEDQVYQDEEDDEDS